MGKPNAVELVRDLTPEVGDDAAYLATIDLSSSSKDLPEWDFRSLTKMLAADMSAGRVLAWGCPEGPVAEFPDGDASVVNFEPTEEQLVTVSRVPWAPAPEQDLGRPAAGSVCTLTNRTPATTAARTRRGR
jgi:hypothetical protein